MAVRGPVKGAEEFRSTWKMWVEVNPPFSSNLTHFITDYWDKENKIFNLDIDDEIIKGCLITHQKQIIHETIRNHYNA